MLEVSLGVQRKGGGEREREQERERESASDDLFERDRGRIVGK